MLKVCYIITKLELGGAQKFTLYAAENLDKDKYDAFLVTGKGGMLDNEAAEKLKVYSLSNLVREISPLKDLKALLHIIKILKIEKPDIVHTHSSKAGIVGRLAAKLCGIKTIVHTIHGYSFNDTQKRHVKYLYIFLEKFCSLFSDKLIVENEEDIEKGVKHKIAKREKFTIICSGIDTRKYKEYTPDPDFRNTLTADKGAKIVITVGPFKPQKNLEDFIRAADIVCKKNPRAGFFIVGDGELRKELEDLIARLGLEKKVTLLGWRRDIIDLLYACDVFVMTSLWEGLPRTILDAMCCAKPVVANDVGGISKVVKDGKTGYLAKPYDFQYTAEKTLYLIDNDEIRRKIGQTARESVGKEFDINYNVLQHEELYLKMKLGS
ncbi:MAG: glycosyltransferase family 4 protein [Endomicrobia bacterium]|nr:glycosyltransferase family 4 protein [Endomicrobiia bacterium]